MKKLTVISCLMAFFAMSVNAQADQQALAKLLRFLNLSNPERHVVMQKAYTDSLLLQYTVQTKSANLTKDNLFAIQTDASYALKEITYTYDDGKRVLETGTLDPTGDTLTKTVYTYIDAVNTQLLNTYTYEDGDPVLTGVELYCGVKDVSLDAINPVSGLVGFGAMVCDSFLVYNFEDGDTMAYAGYFSFNSDGLPVKLVMQLEIMEMLMDAIVSVTYTDKLATEATVTISMMGGAISAKVAKMTASYNSDGQMETMELIPLKNETFDLSAMISQSKTEYSYVAKKTHCISSYEWVVYDSTHADYELQERSYYAYNVTTGEIDTIYVYGNYKAVAGVRNVSSLKVEVSPNPVRDMLLISGLEQPAEVTVFSAEGKKVMCFRADAGEQQISMQALARGTYFISIRNQEGVSVKTVVKQ